MPRPQGRKTFSGALVVSTLQKKFDFAVVSQKGSHVKLARDKYVTIVPLHKELAPGTLRGVLELANITITEFRKVVSK